MTRNSRESEMRDHDIRESFSNYYDSELEVIAAQVKRPGEKLRWVNYAIRNEPTNGVEKAMRHGYSIVPKDRLPSYVGDAFGRNPIADKAIVCGDVVLMGIDEELYKKRERHFYEKCRKQTQQLRGVAEDLGTNYQGHQIHSF